MSPLSLEIRTPDRSLFWGTVESFSLRAEDGGLGIFPGHAPLTTIIKSGEVNIKLESGETKKVSCSAGFLIVKNNQASILVS